MRAPRVSVAIILTASLVAAGACSQIGSATTARPASGTVPQVPLAKLVGQTIVVRMPGRTPTPAFLARIRAGQVGGIVLFAENFGPSGPRALVAELQAAAAEGGNPPLLVAIDQEGGVVKRLPGAPTLAPPQMRTAAIAAAQGRATARNLRRFGINVDLAPVLDVGRGGFITPRTFGSTPAAVASRGVAFANGLSAGRVAATAKHFPGLGDAVTTTDTSVVVIRASRSALLADLLPFRSAIAAGVPLVMVGTAEYPALGPAIPAAVSRTIVTGLLRTSLGYRGVVITDALVTPAITRHWSVASAAVLAVGSGVDMVLAAGTTSRGADATSRAVFTAELSAARQGRLSSQVLLATYGRIVRLKQRIAAGLIP